MIARKLLLLLAACVTLGLAAQSALAAKPDRSGVQDKPMVVMQTNRGDIKVAVFADKAPKTAANFLQYVRDGFYGGTIFHRVIPGFVIQGGGFDRDYKRKKTRAPIVNESDNGLANARGTLSMARTGDPDSATSQFFINLVDNTRLDAHGGQPGYAVFAKVVDGMDVVDDIASSATGAAGPFRGDAPQKPIVIESARVVQQ